jgi:hypothetical protein
MDWPGHEPGSPWWDGRWLTTWATRRPCVSVNLGPYITFKMNPWRVSWYSLLPSVLPLLKQYEPGEHREQVMYKKRSSASLSKSQTFNLKQFFFSITLVFRAVLCFTFSRYNKKHPLWVTETRKAYLISTRLKLFNSLTVSFDIIRYWLVDYLSELR